MRNFLPIGFCKAMPRALVLLLMCVFSAQSFCADSLNEISTTMLEQGVPLELGKNEDYGQFVLAIGLSELFDEELAREDARLQAMSTIGEFIQGVDVSRRTVTKERYTQVGSGQGDGQYSATFTDEIRSQFAGKLDAVRPLKYGKHGSNVYVVMLLAQKMPTFNVSPVNVPEPQTNRDGLNYRDDTFQEGTDTQANPTTKWVEATGFARLSHRSRQEARQVAIENALTNAVYQVSGVSIDSRSSKFNRAVKIVINSASTGYVSQYDIVSEGEQNRSYEVKIRALVDETTLMADKEKIVQRFEDASFAIVSDDKNLTQWLQKELQSLGFKLQKSISSATYTFNALSEQTAVTNHLGKEGVETVITIELEHRESSELLFTIISNTKKSRIFVLPETRARQISFKAATKSMSDNLGREIVEALAI